MKLHFEPNLDYQLAAIEAVCDLFRGQAICRSEFSVEMETVTGKTCAPLVNFQH
jgi:type III restriction enzyme